MVDGKAVQKWNVTKAITKAVRETKGAGARKVKNRRYNEL